PIDQHRASAREQQRFFIAWRLTDTVPVVKLKALAFETGSGIDKIDVLSCPIDNETGRGDGAPTKRHVDQCSQPVWVGARVVAHEPEEFSGRRCGSCVVASRESEIRAIPDHSRSGIQLLSDRRGVDLGAIVNYDDLDRIGRVALLTKRSQAIAEM